MLSAFVATEHSHILRYWGLGFNIWNLGVGMKKPVLKMMMIMINVSQWLKLYFLYFLYYVTYELDV